MPDATPVPNPENKGLADASLGAKTLTDSAVAQAAALLEQNKASQAVALLSGLEGVAAADPILRREYFVQLGWAQFKCGNNTSPEGRAAYGSALAAAEQAGDDPRAVVCVASVLGQSNEHRDDPRLFAIAKGVDLAANPGILNAIVILAGKPGFDHQWLDDIHGLVKKVFLDQPEPRTGTIFGHILQNYGKVFFNILKDPVAAQRCFEHSLACYDLTSKSDLTHVGGAYYWMGQTMLAQGNTIGALVAETASAAFKALAAGDAYQTDEKFKKSVQAVAGLKPVVGKMQWLAGIPGDQ